MARDVKTALFKASIRIDLTPVNRYGDETGGGTIFYTTNLEIKNMVELGVYLERLNEKPFEYIQMVDPPVPGVEDPF